MGGSTKRERESKKANANIIFGRNVFPLIPSHILLYLCTYTKEIWNINKE